jgi:hypothetical protein
VICLFLLQPIVILTVMDSFIVLSYLGKVFLLFDLRNSRVVLLPSRGHIATEHSTSVCKDTSRV